MWFPSQNKTYISICVYIYLDDKLDLFGLGLGLTLCLVLLSACGIRKEGQMDG
ncbi:uncharacterized protein BDW47DRAFT_104360 [Aspergillus candidus]|uniref:Uncharacterized protein n=1 Tax=Aspergillus candidus TaxID=41067 RepID=A0A2I2FDW8_ASPCN|nr:hypothetical protein BDW47DRAFT_104360 [Aspergillus candidus]PLB38822.1 hypothetical protein BDW47DRAFT_104360 [Aspergillus candidus]